MDNEHAGAYWVFHLPILAVGLVQDPTLAAGLVQGPIQAVTLVRGGGGGGALHEVSSPSHILLSMASSSVHSDCPVVDDGRGNMSKSLGKRPGTSSYSFSCPLSFSLVLGWKSLSLCCLVLTCIEMISWHRLLSFSSEEVTWLEEMSV